ncbi:hypothetical protein HYW32_03405 [Candidatus Berkelbacteria bacterium]|nr:hypothetical protein [Candidatus Berkelbacteria bacterium]
MSENHEQSRANPTPEGSHQVESQAISHIQNAIPEYQQNTPSFVAYNSHTTQSIASVRAQIANYTEKHRLSQEALAIPRASMLGKIKQSLTVPATPEHPTRLQTFSSKFREFWHKSSTRWARFGAGAVATGTAFVGVATANPVLIGLGLSGRVALSGAGAFATSQTSMEGRDLRRETNTSEKLSPIRWLKGIFNKNALALTPRELQSMQVEERQERLGKTLATARAMGAGNVFDVTSQPTALEQLVTYSLHTTRRVEQVRQALQNRLERTKSKDAGVQAQALQKFDQYKLNATLNRIHIHRSKFFDNQEAKIERENFVQAVENHAVNNLVEAKQTAKKRTWIAAAWGAGAALVTGLTGLKRIETAELSSNYGEGVGPALKRLVEGIKNIPGNLKAMAERIYDDYLRPTPEVTVPPASISSTVPEVIGSYAYQKSLLQAIEKARETGTNAPIWQALTDLKKQGIVLSDVLTADNKNEQGLSFIDYLKLNVDRFQSPEEQPALHKLLSSQIDAHGISSSYVNESHINYANARGISTTLHGKKLEAMFDSHGRVADLELGGVNRPDLIEYISTSDGRLCFDEVAFSADHPMPEVARRNPFALPQLVQDEMVQATGKLPATDVIEQPQPIDAFIGAHKGVKYYEYNFGDHELVTFTQPSGTFEVWEKVDLGVRGVGIQPAAEFREIFQGAELPKPDYGVEYQGEYQVSFENDFGGPITAERVAGFSQEELAHFKKVAADRESITRFLSRHSIESQNFFVNAELVNSKNAADGTWTTFYNPNAQFGSPDTGVKIRFDEVGQVQEVKMAHIPVNVEETRRLDAYVSEMARQAEQSGTGVNTAETARLDDAVRALARGDQAKATVTPVASFVTNSMVNTSVLDARPEVVAPPIQQDVIHEPVVKVPAHTDFQTSIMSPAIEQVQTQNELPRIDLAPEIAQPEAITSSEVPFMQVIPESVNETSQAPRLPVISENVEPAGSVGESGVLPVIQVDSELEK